MSIQLDKRVYQPNSLLYGMSFAGNSGEEELTIHISAGQSGHVAVIIVAMSCDMGAQVLYDGKSNSLRHMSTVLHDIVMKWSSDVETTAFIDSEFAARYLNRRTA